MRHIAIIAALALAGCSSIKTPTDGYYAANASLVAVLKPVNEYAQACKPKPEADPCHAKVAGIKDKLTLAKKLLANSDRVFVTHDSEYYDLSKTVVENLVKDFSNFARENRI